MSGPTNIGRTPSGALQELENELRVWEARRTGREPVLRGPEPPPPPRMTPRPMVTPVNYLGRPELSLWDA